MAKNPQSPDGRNQKGAGVRPDEIVSRIIPDPANPRVTKLVGYFLGDSASPDLWRLYVNPDMTHFLEFRKEDTIDAERFNTGRIVVWLKPEAKVQETKSKVVAADLLRGGIQGTYLRGARDGGSFGARPMMAAAGGCSLGDCTPPCDSLVTTCNNTGCGNDTVGYTCGC